MIEPLLVFVSRRDRLGKKVNVIEAGIFKRRAQAAHGKFVIAWFFGSAEVHWSTDNQSRTQIAQLSFGGLSQMAQQNPDQFFERVGFAEYLGLVKKPAGEIGFHRQNQPARGLGVEIAMNRVRAGDHPQPIAARAIVFVKIENRAKRCVAVEQRQLAQRRLAVLSLARYWLFQNRVRSPSPNFLLNSATVQCPRGVGSRKTKKLSLALDRRILKVTAGLLGGSVLRMV